MDVAQHVFFGRWPRRGVFIDRRMYAQANAALGASRGRFNSVCQNVESHSGNRQQSVAIARAINFDPNTLILGEPTANLSSAAPKRLLGAKTELKRQGVAQSLTSHRLVRHL